MAKPPKQSSKPLRLEFEDNNLTQSLCGQHDAHLQQIEEHLGVQIVCRGNQLNISGEPEQTQKAKTVLEDLYDLLENNITVTPDQVDAALRITDGLINEKLRPADLMGKEAAVIETPLTRIAPRSVQQHVYMAALKSSTLTFGVGPAGTGKTYIATALAVQQLLRKKVKRIIITRPVVEAGERLGFLPGTFEEKIDPYLRPIFDALDDTVGREKWSCWRENGMLEVAPLAYMRGRTLSHCFMILDEAQNTTSQQMKLFLTRMGEGSQAVVTGDPSQCDLPRGHRNGLSDSVDVLEGLKDIEVIRFGDTDVVRHPLVGRIVRAYDERAKQLDLELPKK